MIDLNAHILPELDDGPANWDEALAILRQSYRDGVHTVVAAPQSFNGRHIRQGPEVLAAVERMQWLARRARIPVTVVPGMEVGFDRDLIQHLSSGKALTVNGSVVVTLSLSTHEIPPKAGELIDKLIQYGYIPLICHPERHREVQANPALFANLADRGAMGLIAAGSLLGEFGPRAQRAAEYLLENGYVQAMGSDARGIGPRPVRLSAALARVTELIGRHAARHLSTTFPEAVVYGARTDTPAATALGFATA